MDFKNCGESLQAIISLAISAHCNAKTIGIRAMVNSLGPIIATVLDAKGWSVRLEHGAINCVQKCDFSADGYRLEQELYLIDSYSNRFLPIGELIVCRDTESFSGTDAIYLETVAKLIELIFIAPFFASRQLDLVEVP